MPSDNKLIFENSKTFNQDNMAAMVMFPDKFFDLAFVDGPYGIGATNMNMGSHPTRSRTDGYGSGPGISTTVKPRNRLNSGGGKLKNRILNKSLIDWDNQIPSPEFFKELFRISKNQIIWGGNYYPLPPTRCIICWDKMQPWDNFSQWEMAWTSFDMPAKMYRISNTGGNNKKPKIHPTEKPILLYDYMIRDFAKPGIKVIDTHLGSGNSRIAAYKANLDFYGYEINPMYFNDQEKQFSDFIKTYGLKNTIVPGIQISMF